MIGSTLGPWRILRELGAGATGTVYLAETSGGGPSPVAIKVLHPQLLANRGTFSRFLREAGAGRAVDHANVVRVLDCDTATVGEETRHYLVMEYVEGRTLREILREEGRVPEALCRHLGREIAAGLAAIHAKGLIHRDLKPSNVLLTRRNEVRIMDLGIARLVDEATRLSVTGDFVGTPLAAAPEQFGGPVDARADLHALGTILFELATGVHPFSGDTFAAVVNRILHERPRPPTEIVPSLSPFFCELVGTLLEKDPEARFAGAARVAQILETGEEGDWWSGRLGRADRRMPVPGIPVPRPTSLHGREHEIERLCALQAKAAAGAGQIVLVEGEAGIGKTRLVSELVARLLREEREIHYLYGSYPPGGAATASGAMSSSLLDSLGRPGLADRLAELLAETPSLATPFAALLRGDAVHPGEPRLDRECIQRCFLRVVSSLAAERPTVFLVDDLHYAPDEGRALFAALAFGLADRRVLLVGTFRPGIPSGWISALARLDSCHHLRLPRLDIDPLERILAEALRSKPLARDLVGRVREKSDGNPWFALEVLRSLMAHGHLVRDRSGRWRRAGSLSELSVPSSIEDLVRARTADLRDEDRELLDLAACVGYEFDPSLIGQVLGMSLLTVLRRLARIERTSRLVRAKGPRYSFDDHQVHTVLTATMSRPMKRAFHEELAQALEERARPGEAGEVPGPVAVRICEQYALSGHGRRALDFLDPALEHLEGSHRYDRALWLLDRVLSARPGPDGARLRDLRLRGARLAETIGDLEGARRRLEENLSACEQEGPPVTTVQPLCMLGRVLAMLGDADGARRALGRAEESEDPDALAAALIEFGGLLHQTGRMDEARHAFGRALENRRDAGDPKGIAIAQGNLGLIAWEEGEPENAIDLLEGAMRLFLEEGDRLRAAKVVGALGLVHEDLGLRDEAAALHEEQLALAREMGYRRGIAIATSNLAEARRFRGRIAEAMGLFSESGRVSREIGDLPGIAATHLNLGVCLRTIRNDRRARAEIIRGIRLFRRLEMPRDRAVGLLHLGRLHACGGRSGRALELLRRAHGILTAAGSLGVVPAVALRLGQLLLTMEEEAEATRYLEAAVRDARASGYEAPAVLATCLLAHLGRRTVAEAREAWREHGDLLEPCERVEVLDHLYRLEPRDELARERDRERAAWLALLPPDARERVRSELGRA